jgi:hypothetical protein
MHLPSDLGQKSAESSAESVAGEIDFKQAQTKLRASLERFVNTVPKAPVDSAESLQTATSITINLLNVLKALS